MSRHAGGVLPDFLPLKGGATIPAYGPRRAAVALPNQDWALDPAANLVASAGWDGAGNVLTAGLQGLEYGAWGSVFGFVRNDRASHYRDGAGNRVNSGYDRRVGQAALTLSEAATGGAETTLYVFDDSIQDATLPNYTMDVSHLDRKGVWLGSKGNAAGLFDRWTASLGFSRLDYDLDNYTRRPQGSVNMQVEAALDTATAELGLSRGPATSQTDLDLDLTLERAKSKTYNHEISHGTTSAFRWPEVEGIKAGVTLAHHRTFATTRLGVAARADYFASRIGIADAQPSLPAGYAPFALSARALYEAYYGAGIDTGMQTIGLSAKARVEQDLEWKGAHVFAEAARLVRHPDVSERAIAQTGTASIREVGNPGLDSEAHHKLTGGLAVDRGGYTEFGRPAPVGSWRARGGVTIDRVTDFITVDRARSQAGITANDGALIHRNVDAWIVSEDVDIQGEIAPGLGLRANLVATRGRNISDGRPLYQMAPLEANLLADWHGGEAPGWNLGGRLRLVAPKRSVDDLDATGSGFDDGPSKGFATLDLYAGLRLGQRATVAAGIENVFDRLYRDHLLAVPQTSTSTVLNAPGRTFFVRAAVAW